MSSLENKSNISFNSFEISGNSFFNLPRIVIHPLSASLFTTLINSDNMSKIDTWNKYIDLEDNYYGFDKMPGMQ